MRIVFLTHYTALYGANRSLLNLIDGLANYGVVAHVVSPGEGAITDALRSRGVGVAVLPLQWWVSRHGGRRDVVRRLYHNIKLLPTLARQVRQWEIDVVYTNSAFLPVGAMLAGWVRLPHVWHLREFCDLDYGFQHDWGARVFRQVVEQADAKIAISKAVRSHLLHSMGSESVHVIYNGVASKAEFDNLYERANSEGSDKEEYTFAVVGLINPNKGQEVAIRALATIAGRVPTARLLIVGSGGKAYVDRCRELSGELGIADRVEFWGYVEDPYKAYMASDAILMCSRYEALGRTTLEAMACCRPVIGYDEAGTAEVIEHEHTGLLYRDGPESLARCMARFVDNPGWARQLGERGWHVARRKYTIEVCAEQVYRVLQSVVTATHA